MAITLSSPATISFWLFTSTESGFDYLRFFVDGAMMGQWSGATAWTQASASLAAGPHTIEWRYTKDGSLTSGMDAVFVDDVVIASPGNPNTGFEGSTSLPAGYTTGGSAAWTVATTMPRGGTNVAASGTIGHSQQTSLFRTVMVPSPSTLTFWYRVSSESGFDYLRVYDNGAMLGQWSGTVPWTMASYPLTAGAHAIEWRYQKDGSLVAGSDRAWIDDVDFGFTTTPTPICGP
jgi:hypothetical protein